MVDTIWVVIISVIGTLIGTVVGGVISYFTAKRQSEARIKEVSEQIDFNERESRRDRLIENRKPYLIELRKSVVKWTVELTKFINKIDSYGTSVSSYKENPSLASKPDSQTFNQELEVISDKMNKQKEKVENLRGETPDIELGNYIDEVFFEEIVVHAYSRPVFFSEWDEWLNQYEENRPDDTSQASIHEALEKIRETSVSLRDSLQKVSKRIEDLLVGDESRGENVEVGRQAGKNRRVPLAHTEKL